jgi:hypothetical protein
MWQRIKAWCKSHRWTTYCIIVIVPVAAVALLMWLPDPTIDRAAQVGDSFNVITSLFTALALIFVILTLETQHREMQDNEQAQKRQLEIAHRTAEIQAKAMESQERSQERQLEIAQKTAQLHALTFLADVNYRMMEAVLDPSLTKLFRDRCNIFTLRSLDILRSADPSLATVSTDVESSSGIHLRRLRRLYYEVCQCLPRSAEIVEQDQRKRALDSMADLSSRIVSWVTRFGADLEHGPRTMLLELAEWIAEPLNYDDKWESQSQIWMDEFLMVLEALESDLGVAPIPEE